MDLLLKHPGSITRHISLNIWKISNSKKEIKYSIQDNMIPVNASSLTIHKYAKFGNSNKVYKTAV